MNINVETLSATKDPDSLSHIELTMRFEEEDYYLFDRLVERIRLTIPEFKKANLIEMK